MNENEKGGLNPHYNNQSKGNNFSKTYQVLEILKTGRRVTAFGLNQAVEFNDARKAISMIRELGFPIKDSRLPDQRKIYFLPDNWEEIMILGKGNDGQLNLFDYD